jgi:hypothetical protein
MGMVGNVVAGSDRVTSSFFILVDASAFGMLKCT